MHAKPHGLYTNCFSIQRSDALGIWRSSTGRQAVGVLDLDKARKYHDPTHSTLVDTVYEPLKQDHCLKGDNPLMEYVLTADERPFRLVDIEGRLHMVDVFDLQKLPVRVLLFMKFVHLETLVARCLYLNDAALGDIIGNVPGTDFGELGKLGAGPVRKIETFYTDRLLAEAQSAQIIKIEDSEIKFLVDYRNRLGCGSSSLAAQSVSPAAARQEAIGSVKAW